MTGIEAPARRLAPVVLALLTVTVLLLAWAIRELLLVAFIAGLFAVYLGSFTDILCDRLGVPRGPGLALALVLTLAALSGVVALLAPAVVEQTQGLITTIPRYVAALDELARQAAIYMPALARSPTEPGFVSAALADLVEFLRRGVVVYATTTGKILIETVAVIVMAFYLAYRPAIYREGLVKLVPPRHRVMAENILKDLGKTLRAWVGAQLLAMVVLAVLTGIGLWLLDVPYWLAFSIFTGFVVLVPFFGTIVSTLLPALIVLGDRGLLAFFAVAMVGVVVHLVEANIVHPIIMHHRVALPPVLTIISVLVMAKLGGVLGLLVAVPTLATMMVMVRHIVVYQWYGERPAYAEPPPAVLRPSREVATVAPPPAL